MATDATGTPTTKGIPKYDTANDAPSGLGFNAAMDSIDSILDGYVQAPASLVSGEAMVWNGTGWARSSVTRINTVRPQDLTQDAATSGQVLAWNGSIWAPTTVSSSPVVGTPITTAVDVTNTTTETSLFSGGAAGNTTGIAISSTTLGALDLLQVTAIGDRLYNSASASVRHRFYLRDGSGGNTLLWDGSTSNATTNASRWPWFAVLNLAALNSTSSQLFTGMITGYGANPGAAPTSGIGHFDMYATGLGQAFGDDAATSVNMASGTRYLDWTVTYGTASTNLSFRLKHAITMVY